MKEYVITMTEIVLGESPEDAVQGLLEQIIEGKEIKYKVAKMNESDEPQEFEEIHLSYWDFKV